MAHEKHGDPRDQKPQGPGRDDKPSERRGATRDDRGKDRDPRGGEQKQERPRDQAFDR